MKLILETLTPVHIGSGETIEPYEYIITDKLYKINIGKFISGLNTEDRKIFLDISSSDMIKTRKFIKEKANISDVAEYSINVSDDVFDLYANKMSDPNNQLSIQTFLKTSDKPFIPGSSIKGAIRTAMLFSMADKPIIDIRHIENDTFRYSNPRNDPFRMIKISDSLPIDLENMRIYAVKTYVKKDKFAASGYNILIESTNSYYMDKAVKIYHNITIDSKLGKLNNFIDINTDKIISSCNEFYHKVTKNELSFYTNSDTSYAYDKYEMIEKLFSNKDDKSFILRLGWGSGYDSVTVNLAKEKPDHKKSRRLINGEFPLGWVKARILEN